jgi:hypothetical protein
LAEDVKEYEIMHFAKIKLLNGRYQLTDKTWYGPGALACLSVRFALEFDLSNGDARNVASEHIERHMRLCVVATTGLETLITVTGSEPLLAEAARQVLDSTEMRPVRLLAQNSDLNCIDRGMRGELIAALLIMRARDASSSETRFVHVTDFIKALLPREEYENKLQNSRPHHSQDTNDTRKFEVIFEGYTMWFNHVIRIKNTDLINVEHLWKFITRGAMVMCANNQRGVDIVLPICDPSQTLSRHNVTAILVQVKIDKSFNMYTQPLFDAMDPFQVNLFSLGASPLPVIRMVFALASNQTGVSYPTIPKRRKHHGERFTAYDIWFAGLSENTFDGIKDDVDSYKELLARSLQPHDAYSLKWMPNDYQNELTKKARASLRRRLEPLAYLEPEHHHKYTPLAQDNSTGASHRKRKKARRQLFFI